MLHDENYKRLFASKLMVEHLLRACLPADLLAAADFSELGEFPPSTLVTNSSSATATPSGACVWASTGCIC